MIMMAVLREYKQNVFLCVISFILALNLQSSYIAWCNYFKIVLSINQITCNGFVAVFWAHESSPLNHKSFCEVIWYESD